MQKSGRCILEAVDALSPCAKGKQRVKTASAVELLRDSDARLLLLDEEIGFAMFASDSYEQRAAVAIEGNFHSTRTRPAGVREEAVKHCEEAGLTHLADSVKKAKSLA